MFIPMYEIYFYCVYHVRINSLPHDMTRYSTMANYYNLSHVLVSSLNNLSLPNPGAGERHKNFEGEMEMQESGINAAPNVEASRGVKEERKPGIGCKPNIIMHRAQHAIARY